jgi:hypothetical protein
LTIGHRAARAFEFDTLETIGNMERFIASWHRVIDHSASKARDEASCLAQISGEDDMGILEAPDGDEMRPLWACRRQIPVAVLWLKGPRFKEVGHRWATRLLLPSQGIQGSIPQFSQPATPTAAGLILEGVLGIWFGKIELPS